MIKGDRIALRIATHDDVDALVAIRAMPEVWARWRGDDLAKDVTDAIDSDELVSLVIEDDAGRIIGNIQWYEEDDPEYRHAGIDIFVEPSRAGKGLGTDALRTLVRHLFTEQGHHRVIIDPAADNAAAIRCYEKAGFRTVGVMRQYERQADGTWGDSLLMELLASDLRDS
jgi:aminoglycoside 6'-N-acetyltransferase